MFSHKSKEPASGIEKSSVIVSYSPSVPALKLEIKIPEFVPSENFKALFILVTSELPKLSPTVKAAVFAFPSPLKISTPILPVIFPTSWTVVSIL